MSARRIAALDMGGTKVKGGLFENGALIRREETDSQAKLGGAHFLSRAVQLLESLGPYDALGVSTAGQVDPDTGVIRYANDNIPHYTGADVRGFFESRFGKPAAVVNDVYAAALGEGAQGAARGEDDYLCLTYGTGIGGGVVIGGQPYYGAGPSAGVMLGGLITHPGQMSASDPFSGSYERFASASALVAAAQAADPSLSNGRAVFARLEEPAVQRIVDQWLDEAAAGVCALIHIYNVPCVILGGGVMEQPYAIEGLRGRVEKALIPGFRGVRIEGAALGNLAGLYGAASLAGRRIHA